MRGGGRRRTVKPSGHRLDGRLARDGVIPHGESRLGSDIDTRRRSVDGPYIPSSVPTSAPMTVSETAHMRAVLSVDWCVSPAVSYAICTKSSGTAVVLL